MISRLYIPAFLIVKIPTILLLSPLLPPATEGNWKVMFSVFLSVHRVGVSPRPVPGPVEGWRQGLPPCPGPEGSDTEGLCLVGTPSTQHRDSCAVQAVGL